MRDGLHTYGGNVNRRGYEPGPDWTLVYDTAFFPIANDILADTGQLAAGVYQFRIHMVHRNDNAGPWTGRLEHRNATNTANVTVWGTESDRNRSYWYNRNPSLPQLGQEFRFMERFALNERMQWRALETHNTRVYIHTWYRKVSQ